MADTKWQGSWCILEYETCMNQRGKMNDSPPKKWIAPIKNDPQSSKSRTNVRLANANDLNKFLFELVVQFYRGYRLQSMI